MSGSIAVFPNQQFLGSNGLPVANGTVTVYAANTLTLAQTWQDKDQTILNTNPIVLDALGQASIWIDTGVYYDMVLKDSLGATIRTSNDVVGATSVAATTTGQWVQYPDTPTYIDSKTFTVPGNQVTSFEKNRKILCYVSPGLIRQGTIVDSVFSTVTTVTVLFPLSSMGLNSGLTRVDLSIITPTLSPIWAGDNFAIEMKDYTGPDIVAQVGATYLYTAISLTTLPLRLACNNGEIYGIEFISSSWNTGLATGAPTVLKANNNNFSGTPVVTTSDFTSQVTASGNTVTANNFQLDAGFTCSWFKVRCFIQQVNKVVESRFRNYSNTFHYYGGSCSVSSESGSWTSLGTITWANTANGTVIVRRLK